MLMDNNFPAVPDPVRVFFLQCRAQAIFCEYRQHAVHGPAGIFNVKRVLGHTCQAPSRGNQGCHHVGTGIQTLFQSGQAVHIQ